MSDDPTCRICGEPKSKHVPTEEGPFTHPREAAGEGKYRLVEAGTFGADLFSGEIDDTPWERYEFVPTEELGSEGG